MELQIFTRQQGKTKIIDKYVTDLRVIAKNWTFGTLENDMLRGRIFLWSKKVNQKLFRDNKLTLNRALSVCRISEKSAIQLEGPKQ